MNALKKCLICGLCVEEGRGAKLKNVGFNGLIKASLLRGDNRFHETKDITFPQTVHIDCRRNYIRLGTIKADDKRSAAAQDESISHGTYKLCT